MKFRLTPLGSGSSQLNVLSTSRRCEPIVALTTVAPVSQGSTVLLFRQLLRYRDPDQNSRASEDRHAMCQTRSVFSVQRVCRVFDRRVGPNL
jgi:hypothetical protein